MTDPASVPAPAADDEERADEIRDDPGDDPTAHAGDDRTAHADDDPTALADDGTALPPPAPASLAPGPSSRLAAPAPAEEPSPDAEADEPAPDGIPELDPDALEGGRELVASRPGLGRLASLVVWITGAQGAAPPRPFTSPVALVAVAAHDEARYVDRSPRPTPAARAADRAADLAPEDIPLRVLDLSSEGPWFVRASSGDIRTADALTDDEAVRAFALGRLAVDREVDGGADVLLVGALAGDNACAVATLAAVITGRQPQTAVPRTGIATDVWIRTVEVVRDARVRAKPVAGRALPLLAAIGGADLAALAGILVQAARRRTPVLVSGPAAHVAGLVAETYAEGSSLWWTSASASGDPAEAAALTALELDPVLDLGLNLDGCGGAVLAYGLIQDLLGLV